MTTKYRVYKSDPWGGYGASYPTVRPGFTDVRMAERYGFDEPFYVAMSISQSPDDTMPRGATDFYKIVAARKSYLYKIHTIRDSRSDPILVKEVAPLTPGEPLRQQPRIIRDIPEGEQKAILARLGGPQAVQQAISANIINSAPSTSFVGVLPPELQDLESRPIIAPRQFRPSGLESMSIRKKEKDRNDMLKLIKKNQDGSSARLRSLLRMSGVTGIDPSDFANFDDFYQALEDQTQLGIYKPIPTMQEQLIPLPIEGVEDTPVFLDPSKRRISFAPTASMRFFTPIELEHVIQDESSDFEDSSDSSDSF